MSILYDVIINLSADIFPFVPKHTDEDSLGIGQRDEEDESFSALKDFLLHKHVEKRTSHDQPECERQLKYTKFRCL